MKAALSIVLAGLLVTTPPKMVLAQAAQQEAVSVQQNTAPDRSSHRPIRVPPITDGTAPLWRPLRTHDNLADALPDGRTMPLAPLSTFAFPVADQTLNKLSALPVEAIVVLIVLIVVVVAICSPKDALC